jgi:hypothetical protein
VPEHLGTPSTSRTAAPKFWSLKEGYAPQPPQIHSLFKDADLGPNDPREPGGIACSLGLEAGGPDGAYDPFSNPDPEVHVTLERGREKWKLFVDGRDDVYNLDFAVPLLGPRKADRVTVSVIDDDLHYDDFIETLRTTLKGGGPFSLTGRWATVECRPYSRDVAEQYILKQKDDVDKALSAMESIKPDLVEEHFGLGRNEDGGARGVRWEIEYLAGLTGWEDPRVQKRLARLTEAESTVSNVFSGAFDALQKHLPKMGSYVDAADGAIHSRVHFYECSPTVAKTFARWAEDDDAAALRKHGCVLGLEVTNLTSTPMEIDGGSVGPWHGFRIVARTGAVFYFGMVAVTMRGKTRKLDDSRKPMLAPGATAVLFGVPYSRSHSAAPAPPLFVRGFHGSRTLETPSEGGTLAGGALQMRVSRVACGADAASLIATVTPASTTDRPEPGTCVMQTRMAWQGTRHPLTIDRFLSARKPLGTMVLLFANQAKVRMEPLATLGANGLQRLTDRMEVKAGATVDVLWVSRGAAQTPPAVTPYQVHVEFAAAPTMLRVDPVHKPL